MTRNPLSQMLLFKLPEIGDSPLLQAALLLTAMNVLAGGLGYAYQVLMGRLLTPGDFAFFSGLMAWVMVVGAPLNAVVMLVARRVASLNAACRTQALPYLYWNMQACLAGATLLFFCVVQACAPWAMDSATSTDGIAVWLFGGALVLNSLGLVNGGFLQGLERFRWLGGAGLVGVVSKIAISVALVRLCDAGARGAIGGVLLSSLLGWFAGLWCLRREIFPFPILRHDREERVPFGGTLPVVLASTAFAAMTQLDVVLVNRYFDSSLAAQYAAAAVLGKAVLYFPGGIALALLPIVAARHARKQDSGSILGQALMITLLLCGGMAIGYAVCGRWLAGLLYGPKYPEAGGLLASYGCAILPMALVMVAEHFLIAQGRVVFTWLFVLIAAVQVAAIHFWHPNPQAVIGIIGLCGVALATAGCGVLLWDSCRGRP